jgi:hypothetical protein
MKRVFAAPDLLLAGHVQTVLEQHGIPSFVRNALLLGAMGELPPAAVPPEVWIVDDDDYARAMQLVADLLDSPPSTPWECLRCGERIEGQFGACWACGEPAPWRES